MADISNSNETATERELNESVEMKPDGTDKTEGNDESMCWGSFMLKNVILLLEQFPTGSRRFINAL